VIPATIFVINFIRIRKCLVNLDDILKRQAGCNKGHQSTAAIRRKRKTIKTVFIIVLAFFICWTPNTIMFFVFQYAGATSLPANSVTFEVSVILASQVHGSIQCCTHSRARNSENIARSLLPIYTKH